ncbi:DUF3857 domain-containing protein [Spongiimicrobium sp. 3-5]|uniref:DUF3857 domain-containing protein n=1 Tax=Spongiimicrobium sp. 3-5 TaxID=3332596 RepID=UPI00397EB6E2
MIILFLSNLSTAQEPSYSSLLIDKSLKENANAVVRLDEMKIHLVSNRHMTYTVKQAVTVLNKLGNPYARTRAYYDKENKIKKIEAYVYDAFGNETKHIKRKDFQDLSAADGFSLYTDDRLLNYKYTPTQYPYTLVFTYEMESTDTGAFPSWYFMSGYLSSVEKSVYEISYDKKELKPVIKEHNFANSTISKKEYPNRIRYYAENITAIKREDLCPGFKSLTPRLSARLKNFHYKGYDGNVDTWEDLGAWVDANLLKGRTDLSEATVLMAKSMVKGVEDDLEKAKIIYKYVQDNTRYISVQIGIGGFQPISAIDVDRVKYGDCKGLSNYTKALLEAIGVSSHYVVVQAGGDKVDFDDDFPDLIQGNHVILAIPYQSQYYWIDCTSQIHPFGFVGDFTDDRKVLVVKPNGGEIVKTVAYIDQENYQHTEGVYSLTSEGDIYGEVAINSTGVQYDNRFSWEELPKNEVIKRYKKYWHNINNLEVQEFQFQNDRDTIRFTEKVKLKAASYGSKSGERMLFAVNAFNKNDNVPNRYRNRKLPFEVQRGFLDEDEFNITLPEGYTIEAIPNMEEIENEFGAYSMSVQPSEDGKTIHYKRSLFVKKGLYPKEKYKAYRDFRKKTAGADNAKVVLIQTSK